MCIIVLHCRQKLSNDTGGFLLAVDLYFTRILVNFAVKNVVGAVLHYQVHLVFVRVRFMVLDNIGVVETP
jgi:hypothetical protein